MVGCALFLVSGHLALVGIGGGRRFWRRRDLGWWIVAVNQIGSILFMVSAVASFVSPVERRRALDRHRQLGHPDSAPSASPSPA